MKPRLASECRAETPCVVAACNPGHALITHLGTGRSGIRWQGRWRRQSDSATAEVDLTSSNLGGPVGTAGGPADAASELAELREEFHL